MSFSRGFVLEVIRGNSSAHMETMERLEQRSGMLAASSRCWSGRQGSRIPPTERARSAGASALLASNLEGDNDRLRHKYQGLHGK